MISVVEPAANSPHVLRSERAQRQRKVNETRAYIANYLKDRAVFLREEQERMDEEDRKIAEFADSKTKQQEAEESRKASKKFEADRIYQEVRFPCLLAVCLQQADVCCCS